MLYIYSRKPTIKFGSKIKIRLKEAKYFFDISENRLFTLLFICLELKKLERILQCLKET